MPPRAPFDVQRLVERSRSGKCFICEFLRSAPGYEHIEICRTAQAVVFLNKYPTLFGYVLVAPLRHVEQVTGDFTEPEYLDLHRLIYRTSEAIREILEPERVYVLSLGSKAANAHVHWHIAPLPPDVPLEQQQFYALMQEHGVVAASAQALEEYAAALRTRLTKA